jgi:hypothetical protein
VVPLSRLGGVEGATQRCFFFIFQLFVSELIYAYDQFCRFAHIFAAKNSRLF